MDKHLEHLVYFIEHPSFVVFWIEATRHGDIRHKLNRVKEDDDELKAYIAGSNRGKWVDLWGCNGDYSEFEVMAEIDWKVFSEK